MQSNIFAVALPSLKALHFDFDVEGFVNFLGRYRAGDWIYPGTICRNLKIDIKTAYTALECCKNLNLVTQYLDIYCPICHKFSGQYFRILTDIPDTIYCIHCDEEISNPVKYSVVVYKVSSHE